jgi:hypothetical protein
MLKIKYPQINVAGHCICVAPIGAKKMRVAARTPAFLIIIFAASRLAQAYKKRKIAKAEYGVSLVLMNDHK